MGTRLLEPRLLQLKKKKTLLNLPIKTKGTKTRQYHKSAPGYLTVIKTALFPNNLIGHSSQFMAPTFTIKKSNNSH